MDVMNVAARQQATLEELDAIAARLHRGEITPAEADALGEAVLRRVHEETIALSVVNTALRTRRRRNLAILAAAILVLGVVAVALTRF